MEKVEIENLILKQLYDWWETHSGSSVFYILDQINNVEEITFTRIADKLEEDNLIKGVGQSQPCDITSYGILEAEKRGLVDTEKITRYEKIRFEILKAANQVYENEGRYGEADAAEIIEKNNFGDTEFHNNLAMLDEIYLVDGSNGWSFQSTELGREQFKQWQIQTSLNQEFENISKFTAQKRGIEFQKLMTKALEFSGWQSQESVKTSYEEIDIIINKNREYYLIECKWEKEPVEPIAINHLLSKLDKRADTNGIVMSMSGFTSGAIKDAEDSLYKKLVLLFGKDDVEEITANPESFEILLNEKYRDLVTKRKATFK